MTSPPGLIWVHLYLCHTYAYQGLLTPICLYVNICFISMPHNGMWPWKWSKWSDWTLYEYLDCKARRKMEEIWDKFGEILSFWLQTSNKHWPTFRDLTFHWLPIYPPFYPPFYPPSLPGPPCWPPVLHVEGSVRVAGLQERPFPWPRWSTEPSY